MNQNNEYEVKLRRLIEAVKGGREAIIGLVDARDAAWREINADRYLTPDQRELARKKAHDEAFRDLEPVLASAREAVEALRAEAETQIKRQGVGSAVAEARLSRLIAQGLSLGDVIDRAQQHGDRELLAAAYGELRYLAIPGRNGSSKFVDAPELKKAAALALAELAPGTEREALVEALQLADSNGVEAAGRVAARAFTGAGPVSRLEYAYALSDIGDAAGVREGGGEGGGDG